MIRTFRTEGTRDIFEGRPSKQARRCLEYSIRINRQYRVCFRWLDADAWDVEITDYH